LAVIDSEDFAMVIAAQRSFDRGSTRTVILGRNEPALQHAHAAYRAAMAGQCLAHDESRAA
jgi:hypothetical protein